MSSTLRLLVALLIAVLGSPSPARAAPEESAPPSSWYGYQPALLDAGAFALTVGAFAGAPLCFWSDTSCGGSPRTTTVLGLSAVALYALGGPVVHALHRQGGRAAASAAVRVAPLALAALLGPRPTAAGADTVVLGVAAAVVLDDVFLSWDRERPSTVAVVPAIDPATHARLLLLARAF
jgi:hypothetical protein